MSSLAVPCSSKSSANGQATRGLRARCSQAPLLLPLQRRRQGNGAGTQNITRLRLVQEHKHVVLLAVQVVQVADGPAGVGTQTRSSGGGALSIAEAASEA